MEFSPFGYLICMMDNSYNHIAELAARCIQQTNASLFLTGKAGTGKTTFLRNIVQQTYKNTIVVAPTGVAAINAGGVTIHSLFQLPLGLFLPVQQYAMEYSSGAKIITQQGLIKHLQMHERKRKMLRELELLIIDEVSMLRADVLDAIDFVLRYIRRKRHLPFGGVQVLFIGDLQQLPPVVRDDEWRLLQDYYNSIYFFDALVLRDQKPLYFELTNVYRQADERFVQLLNRLRDNMLEESDAEWLNSYYRPDFVREAGDPVITLTTHNNKAAHINKIELEKLDTASFFYDAEIKDEFNESSYPLEKRLELREGAQVMFIKNDSSDERRYYNGKIGTVTALGKDSIQVIFPDSNTSISVEKHTWQNIRYTFNETTQEIEETTIGTFTHYPIKLAWAITIHKSQGLTFQRAIMDINDAFASGQVYVALSRLTSLNGLILTAPVRFNQIGNDEQVSNFTERNYQSDELIEQAIEAHKTDFLEQVLADAFNFRKMVQELHVHVGSYIMDEGRSEKQQYQAWAKKIAEKAAAEKVHADNFSRFLQQAFQTTTEEQLRMIEGRVQKACAYFSPILQDLSRQCFEHIREVSSEHKKVKTYLQELLALEENIFQQLYAITKANALTAAILNGEAFNKEKAGLTSLQQERQKNMATLSISATSTAKKRGAAPTEEKPPKPDTKMLTFELYQSGKTVEDIAKERNLTQQTIYNHLCYFIENGKIPVTDLLDTEKVSPILQCIARAASPGLSDIKQLLGDEYTFEDIKLAMAYQRFLEQQPAAS